MSRPAAERAAWIAGCVLLLVFFGLGASSNGLRITFNGLLTTSSPGELQFWLAASLLLCPATLLIGYGHAGPLGSLLRRAAIHVDQLTARERWLGLAALTAAALSAAILGRAVFLLDLPVTDDEYAIQFGGRVLASGRLMAHLDLPPGSLPDLFLYSRDGAVGSFGWIGAQAVAALAELTGLGSALWALLAVVPLPAVAVIAGRRLGPRWGAAAALLFLCSPMAGLLSLTTHEHLASRACLALALVAFSFADAGGRAGWWAFAGASLGLGFLCRPPEVTFLSAPLVAFVALEAARRRPGFGRGLALLAAGFLPAVTVLAWHAYATTGNPLLPPRFAPGGSVDISSPTLWGRFGDNFSYNVLMLAVWFLGPVGLALVAVGVVKDRFSALLGLCVAADLGLAMFHDNSGLHIVGPIHYSECAVPLTLIATFGLAALVGLARRHAVDVGRVAAPLAVCLVLGLGIFTSIQALALRSQAEVQQSIYAAIFRAVRDPAGRRAVVLAPDFYSVVGVHPGLHETGTWVHEWRRPRLDLSDDVLFLRDESGTGERLRARFPERRFFRMARLTEPPFLALVGLDDGVVRPLGIR